jgi:site-specific DNA-methyltransferase (adenine-specific)
VDKFIDKRLGAPREVTGANPNARPNRVGKRGHACGAQTEGEFVTAPATIAARCFDGWHTNLGPSWEPALLFRKPLDGTLADNALAHGVAGLWIDGARIETSDNLGRPQQTGDKMQRIKTGTPTESTRYSPGNPLGRWPKNAILCCEETTCGDAGHDGEHASGCPVHEMQVQGGVRKSGGGDANGQVHHRGEPPDHSFGHGRIGASSRVHGDEGYVSRFFYIAKVSRKERAGIPHPCMKPIKLCQQIATLLLPPPRADGQPRRILVPYSGSGSEMIGCLLAGWDEVVGIENDEQWVAASRARIADAMSAR